MSLAKGNNTPTRPRIEPGSPDPESDALTTRPVRSPNKELKLLFVKMLKKSQDGRGVEGLIGGGGESGW